MKKTLKWIVLIVVIIAIIAVSIILIKAGEKKKENEAEWEFKDNIYSLVKVIYSNDGFYNGYTVTSSNKNNEASITLFIPENQDNFEESMQEYMDKAIKSNSNLKDTKLDIEVKVVEDDCHYTFSFKGSELKEHNNDCK